MTESVIVRSSAGALDRDLSARLLEEAPVAGSVVFEARPLELVASLGEGIQPGELSRKPGAEEPLYSAVKRLLDIIGGLAGLILFSPLIFVVAAVTKLMDGGPALYRHTRVGLHGQEFICYKFRTMISNADEMKSDILHDNHHDDDRTFKIKSDPRVTSLGWWLRRASIDEVPQLWNVVKGDMSLVGPRPPIPEEVERYSSVDMRRLLVKPGLTCIWQVSGRSELAFPIQLHLDLQYIEHRSFWLDVKLIVMTIPAVLSARGAY
jgi:lipopolysaccharide/colanic/teichoic acid biosynthesis glycosyltransferase